MNEVKGVILSILGIAGGAIAYTLGGWDTALQTLIIFMVIDFIGGLFVAGFFKKSNKSDSGALDSRAGWKGLLKKVMSLAFVAVAVRLDLLMNTTFVRDTVIIALVSNETLSIVENAGLMGVPIPDVIRKAIDILNKKGDDDDENN